jgi:uncharacterized protein involved in copper resistance
MNSRLTALALAAIALAVMCRGKPSIASKSAAAYHEASAKGIPLSAGAHGGHATEGPAKAEGSEMTSMDHGSMAGMDHSQMQHGSMQGMSKMPGMQHGSVTGMDHSQMQHGSMAGMDHSQMQQGSMPGMSNMAGMQHGSATSAVIAAPASNSGIAKLSPSSTLQQDAFDQPAPVAVQEASKASGGGQTTRPPHSDH